MTFNPHATLAAGGAVLMLSSMAQAQQNAGDDAAADLTARIIVLEFAGSQITTTDDLIPGALFGSRGTGGGPARTGPTFR
ncbi:hypothetical protein [Citreimonas salinaria]|uniref:Uncharacterized protein n=1 Tax=Citreimonas salinaria TaxID=321339 RepID=A0A1H3MYH0_9RHOB|nr:hypothetical protein [Citreimonas salinaria]SDY81019.1 hypothetical protein SAMN05444340_1194 [Citreimonas salinaria]